MPNVAAQSIPDHGSLSIPIRGRIRCEKTNIKANSSLVAGAPRNCGDEIISKAFPDVWNTMSFAVWCESISFAAGSMASVVCFPQVFSPQVRAFLWVLWMVICHTGRTASKEAP